MRDRGASIRLDSAACLLGTQHGRSKGNKPDAGSPRDGR